MNKVLIVEDDQTIARLIANHLKKWDYTPKIAEDFKEIMALFTDFNPQLVLLDLSLPFFNGYHWCQKIRQVSEVPVIFISSTDDDMNIITAMDMGADDYITKPFDLKVLIAKVNALFRRTYSFSEPMDFLQYKEVILNLENAHVSFKGREKELSKNEFKIMKILMKNKETIISRDELMIHLWETESFIDDNTLTVNVSRLRQKLESMGINDFIKTKKGLGYVVT